MASKVMTILEDDLDGSKATETVRFALDGVEWEIDLSERNANRLRNSLSDFIAHGRKVGGRAKRGTGSRGSSRTRRDQSRTQAIRKWAQSHGYDVSERGRVPAHIVEAYEAAH
jgi:hypothetical protein